jgi:predicted MFS family arabinose efflux permease
MWRSRVLLVLAVGAIDFAFQQAITPALPAIQLRFDASPTAATWLITGFLLASVVALSIAGPLGDRYGRRRVVLWSLAAFAIGSVVCAVAEDIGVLIAGRVIQGFGGGIAALALAIVRDQVPAAAVPHAVGFLIGATAMGAVLGVLVTGVLVDDVSISSLFWLLFGVSVITAAAVRRFVPESPIHTHDRIDWPGALLLAVGLATLMLAIADGNAWGWGSRPVLALIAGSLVLVGAFIARERATPRPLVDLGVMGRRPIRTANAAGFAVGFAFYIPYPLVSFIAGYPQSTGYGLGMTSTQVALMLVPGASAALVAGVAGGRLLAVLGARRQALVSTLLAASCYVALLTLPRTAAALAVALIPVSAAIGLGVGAIVSLTLRGSTAAEAGVTASVNAVVRTVGSALGPQVAIAVVVAVPSLASGLPAEAGFDDAFLVGLLASIGALVCVSIVPSARADPLLSASDEPTTAAPAEDPGALGDFAPEA